MSIGWKIKVFGTDTLGDTGTFPEDYTELHVLSLDYTPRFRKSGERGEHGKHRSSRLKDRTFSINTYPVDFDEYYSVVNTLYDIFSKQYVYLNKGDYPMPLTTTNGVIRIVATGDSIEHDHPNGNKSIDFEVAIYE